MVIHSIYRTYAVTLLWNTLTSCKFYRSQIHLKFQPLNLIVADIEKARNSQLAREIEIALPAELDQEQQIQLVREYVKDNFVSVGMCADVAIHDKKDGNPHAHIMLTMRPLEQCGEWGAKSKKEYILDKGGQRIKLKNGTFKSRKADTVDWNNREKAEAWRQAWADIANSYLAAQDRPERIDHRSFKRQGVEQIPTVHMGVAATQMERRGIATDKGEQNRRIREENRLLKEVKRRIAALKSWVKEKTILSHLFLSNHHHCWNC